MRKSRRQAVIRVVQWVAVSLAGLDVALYLAVVRPLGRMRSDEQQARDAVEQRLGEQRARLERFRRFQAALPDAGQALKVFVRDHVPSRRRGFSRAARLVRRLSEASGLQLAGVSYRLNATDGGPLQRLGMEVTVEGRFSSLLKFAHAIETDSDFILVRDFAFQPGEGETLALRLGADLYLEP